MDIDVKILGPGCKKCRETAEVVRMVAGENGLAAQIEVIGDTETIAGFGTIEIPAVVVDGDVKCMGRVPAPGEVLLWLRKAAGGKEQTT
jgi:small redox-active disulfide protein 2